jgi:hypothetical protein
MARHGLCSAFTLWEKVALTATARYVHNWTVIFSQDSRIGDILINENVTIFFKKALELTAEAETLMLTLAF